MVPASGLDSKVTAEMYALIAELNRNDGITVIMILHDITAAVQYASHLLHIGDTVFFGTKAEYLRSPQGRLFAAEKGGAMPYDRYFGKADPLLDISLCPLCGCSRASAV